MTELKRKAFENAGLTLSYLDNAQTSADVPIVLLHGFTASAVSNWLETGWIAALTQAGRRVLALDARGHGNSDKPHDSTFYPSDVMMEDSLALLNQLGIERADYLGYSMGARMSAFVAINHPGRVRKLLLGGMGIHLTTGIGNPQPIADALLAEGLHAVKHRHARRFRRLAERGGNDLVALAHCILSSRQAIAAGSRYNDSGSLAKITAKTLILVGDKDDIGGNPHELAALISNSQAIEIADCNHFNALSHDAFRAAGLAFLLEE